MDQKSKRNKKSKMTKNPKMDQNPNWIKIQKNESKFEKLIKIQK